MILDCTEVKHFFAHGKRFIFILFKITSGNEFRLYRKIVREVQVRGW